ncbi:reverse transcriptase domain-containing protein [Tanacetum coccineum]|uniref:Reverse transcriptase domain-containing protein n=1 Tax=Tanacetum coccineum TaxID=301880 RepID=A0ABQ5AN13_9ASTR
MEDDVDISALTMEQYISLIPDDIKPGIVYPKIGDDVEFEINANFMRELRRKLFAGTDDEDAYKHVRTVLEIVDLFYFPGITHDAIMLRVFPITLKGRALRWKNRLPAGTITTWDLLKKEFIWRYCHPFITAKKLEEIRNFKQERDETLYHAWERYNDLLYQCPLHDLNCQQKVYIFYTGLDISTCKILNSNGYDETTTGERINDVLDNVDAIHESFKGGHLTTERKVKAITIMGKENMKEPIPRDLPPTPFLGNLKEQIGSPYRTRETVRIIGNPKEIHNAKAQEDDGDMDIGWDITRKGVERLRKFLTPTIHTLPNLEPVVQLYIPLGPVHDRDKIVKEDEHDYDIPLNDNVMQPLTPQTVHITPPDDNYVALAINPMSNKQLNKFEEEFSHITKDSIARRSDGTLNGFFVRQTYCDFQNKDEIVNWPIQGKLTTQDKVRKLGSYDMMTMENGQGKIKLQCNDMDWLSLVNKFSRMQNGNSIGNIVRRLCLASCIYLIWQKRNNRIFKDEKRSIDGLFKIFNDTVKLRHTSLKVKLSQVVINTEEALDVKMNVAID